MSVSLAGWFKDGAGGSSKANCNRFPGKNRSDNQFLTFFSDKGKEHGQESKPVGARLAETCPITLSASAVELEMPAWSAVSVLNSSQRYKVTSKHTNLT